MKNLFDDSSYKASKLVTRTYSTSFSWGIRMFAPEIRPAIYAIYGFVRYADEIVDSFHEYDQELLFSEFRAEYQKALRREISMNPILNAFQEVVRKYNLQEYVPAFLDRMEYDLRKTKYTSSEELKDYIYGSADVVGLMCLRVFVHGDAEKFEKLKPYAMSLGSAFQKVNFLRDLKDDTQRLGRTYFPNLVSDDLTEATKADIIQDIEADFHHAKKGILNLPPESRLGVYVAYIYYRGLLQKLKRTACTGLTQKRIRISNPVKLMLLTKAYLRFKLNFM